MDISTLPRRISIVLLSFGMAMTAAAQAADPVAKVNGTVIPQSRLDAMLKGATAQGQPDSPELRNRVRDELITREVLLQEATKKGIEKTPDVANQIEHKGLLLSVREWAERPEIKRLGLTEAALRMRLKKGWSVERALTTPKMSDGPKPKEKPEAPKEKPARAKPAPKVEVTMAAPVVTEAERIARFEAAVNVLNTLGWSCSMVATTPRGSVLVEISIPASAP